MKRVARLERDESRIDPNFKTWRESSFMNPKFRWESIIKVGIKYTCSGIQMGYIQIA